MRVAALAITAVVTAAGCGGGADRPRPDAAPVPAVTHYVASPTLSRHSAESLLVMPGLGRFRVACTRPGVARISYAARLTGQTVAAETARVTRPIVSLFPGKHVAVMLDHRIAPRADWQVAIVSEGRIDVATATVTVATLGSDYGCFVSAKADRVRRGR